MKKSVIFYLILILAFNLVSAGYQCNGNETKDWDDIDIGEIEAPNGLKIAVLETTSQPISVDLLIDAGSATLTESENTTTIELKTDDYDVELINLTGDIAIIKIEGDEEEIEVEKVEDVDDLKVYIMSASGTYPGDSANIELFVGIDYLFLHYNDFTSIKTVDGEEYLIEFQSSNGNSALFEIRKCEGGSFTEVADQEELGVNNTENNITDSNLTDSNESSETIVNDSGVNETENIESDVEESEGLGGIIFFGGLSIYRLILLIVTILVLIVLLFFYFRKKGSPPSYRS